MTTPTPARRPSRRTLLLGGGLLLILLVLVVVLTTRGGSTEPGGTTDAAAPTSSTATSTSSAPATVTPDPTPSASGPTDAVDALPTQQPAVGLSDVGDAQDGVTARLTDVSVVQATGQGPGSVSGRALRVTVELTNGTSTDLYASGVDVTADTGTDHAPAAPVEDGQTAGLTGSIAPGASGSGTYLFSIPDDVGTVTVLVGHQAGAPLIVFTGQV